MTQAGVQLINARGSCTLDTRCGVTRVVGIASLGAKKRMRIEIPNPGKNRIWTQLVFRGLGYGAYAASTDWDPGNEKLTKVETWEDLQGITVTLPFKPNAAYDPEFPYAYYHDTLAAQNPRAIIYGFY
jgi:hypothetical protein